jgi:hypothetical protein
LDWEGLKIKKSVGNRIIIASERVKENPYGSLNVEMGREVFPLHKVGTPVKTLR